MYNEKPKSMGDLKKETMERTLKNRDDTYEQLMQYPIPVVLQYVVETLMAYSHSEDVLSGQYMMLLDAFHKVLIAKKVIRDVDCGTLEEFLNDVPFHSHFYPDGNWGGVEE